MENAFEALKSVGSVRACLMNRSIGPVNEWNPTDENLEGPFQECFIKFKASEKKLKRVHETVNQEAFHLDSAKELVGKKLRMVEGREKELELKEKNLSLRLSEIELREQDLSVARGPVVEGEFIRESVEKFFREVEEREMDFRSYEQGRNHELDLREERLRLQREEFVKEIESREKQVKSDLIHIEKMKATLVKKLKAIESRDSYLKTAEDLIERIVMETESVRVSKERRLREVEEKEKQFFSFKEGKMRENGLEEDRLNRMRKQFVEEVKLLEKKMEQEKPKHGQLERLKLAQTERAILDEKVNKIEYDTGPNTLSTPQATLEVRRSKRKA